ncbi:MAG: carboxypeptidase-like regulatory domain-containing protein, partial [Armatimonadota bacterium]
TGPFKGTEACLKIASPGSNDAFTVYPLAHNTTYYFSAYAQDTSGNWSLVANALGTTSVDVTPPANVTQFTAKPYTSKDLIISWKNPNDLDFRGTMIRFKTTGYPTSRTDGTLLVNKEATPGSNDFHIHTNLVAGQTYYYSAFSYDYSNLYSSGANVSGVPIEMGIMHAKLLPDSSPISLLDKVVSGIFTNENAVYISEKDGSAGVRVNNNGAGLSIGDRVNISGVISTRKPDGVTPSEREIASAQITKIGSNYAVKPFGMGNYAVGGGAIPPYVPGVTDGPINGVFTPAIGLNTMGMLVKTYGTVTRVLSSGFYVDDGKNIPDIPNRLGILITTPDSNIPVQVGYVVSVSGIVRGSIPSGWPTNRRNIIMRSWSDLTIHYSGPEPGVIAGTVMSSLGNPISGATISTNTGGYTTTSLSDGTFSIPNVIAGTYNVTATANGYTSDIDEGVVVGEGETVNLNFVLTPTTGTISGYVRDNNNQPISGATVSTNIGGYTTTSASDGSYTLNTVSPGTYSVTASKTGYSSQTNSNITVNVGQTTTSNFNLAALYGAISGVVRDSNGIGVVGATVSTSSGGYSTVSGTGGAYTLSSVSPGTYTVTASKTNYNSDTKTNISVTAGNTTAVDFVITEKTGTISGTVLNFYGNPVVGATISTNYGGYSTTSGSGGAYTLSNVLIGTYSLTAAASEYQNQTISNVMVQENQATNVNFNLNPTATNKVINGDFSSGSFNFWGGKMGNGWGAAWTSNGSGTNGSWDIKSDTYGNCQKASSSANGVGIGIAQEIGGLTPGASYSFTAQGKKTVTNYTLYLGVAQGTGHGSVIPISGTAFPSGTGWQSKTITGTVGATGSVTIYLWGVRDSGSTSDILFDNITFNSF